MILRIFRATVANQDEDRLATFVRDLAIPATLRLPGVRSFQPAIRRHPDGLELVIISTWADVDAMLALGRDLDSPLLLPAISPVAGNGHAEHYELVSGEAARRMPLSNATLRVARSSIPPNEEAAQFVRSRAFAERMLDEAGVVAYLFGRRVVGSTVESIGVSIWESERALAAATSESGQVRGTEELSSGHEGNVSVATYDALTVIDPDPDAPAVLLADDDRHFVHATPAVARLTGHRLGRLLTMRVDELASPDLRPVVDATWRQFVSDGSMAATFSLQRSDGTPLPVRYSARAQTPWPGSHASLIVPADATGAGDESGSHVGPAFADLDEALVRAGLVARFAEAV